ncbi:GspH/FimT family pseudopilin [Polaromonas sp.]|uniref:GspH/FimT family pseudopilin n=1 Tax=Polaromonas sp. TaxID=1869339 RepID=UPI0017B01DB1|nr:GspH/FimT family pseudopilin [Polaromonas sp.]NML84091.1 prepilin-type N-terminal cleavage/methylation domain-containing protein [Polaromonas sp.]
MGRRQKVRLATQAGFTLIELLVVTIIMVMAYSLAGPLVSSGVSSTELKASARQLAAGLRRARSEAVAQRRESVLTIDVEGRRFQLSGDPRLYRLPKDVDVKLFTAQSELVNTNTGSIRFFPDGGSTGGRITVTAKQRQYAVDVNWLTGQVAILD